MRHVRGDALRDFGNTYGHLIPLNHAGDVARVFGTET
jgi:hypothetical protein